MSRYFVPTIDEGHYPDDGGWSFYDNTNILLLSIPMFSDMVHTNITVFHYAWVYNKEINAYIFCVKVNDDKEAAIIFHAEHAGQLLVTEESYHEFSMAITDVPLEQVTEDQPYLYLHKITLHRSANADW